MCTTTVNMLSTYLDILITQGQPTQAAGNALVVALARQEEEQAEIAHGSGRHEPSQDDDCPLCPR